MGEMWSENSALCGGASGNPGEGSERRLCTAGQGLGPLRRPEPGSGVESVQVKTVGAVL